MAADRARAGAPATRIIVKVIVYYVVLFAVGAIVWRWLPREGVIAHASLESLFGSPENTATSRAGLVVSPIADSSFAITVAISMFAAILLSLPVAWVYLLTRAKQGYQQSVVQLLIILPLVVTGVVLLVKHSLALAFSLAGIVAAVRFRNTLDDSKDAVYVFLATAVGLASAVNLPVAAVISVIFNATVLVLWFTDFGYAPVELEGGIADRRLKRAKQLARTGTFVARMDEEVFRNMTREQLEGVAQRAWSRANQSDSGTESQQPARETRLRIRTRDLESVRRAIEARLEEHTKQWRFESVASEDDGVFAADYVVVLRKKSQPEELIALVRAAAGADIIDTELR